MLMKRFSLHIALTLTACWIGLCQPSQVEAQFSQGSTGVAALQSKLRGNGSHPPLGSLCSPEEQIVFSCAIERRDKVLSLCSSKTLDKDRGYLQYRFGRPGNLELEFPNERSRTQSAFLYSRYTRPLVTYILVSFSVDGYTYEIHDNYDDEQKKGRRDAYVTVTPPGKDQPQWQMRCRMPATSHLAARLEDVLPNKEYP